MFKQLKAVFLLMLLFLSCSSFALTKVKIPLKLISDFVPDFSANYRAYVYYFNDDKYGGFYRVYTTPDKSSFVCTIDDSVGKCVGERFSTPMQALKSVLPDIQKTADPGSVCKIDDYSLYINCVIPIGNDGKNTGINNETKKPNSNLCGKSVGGIWVPMSCDNPIGSNSNLAGSGSSSGNSSGSGSGSSSGSSSGSGSGSGSGSSNNGSGNTTYIPTVPDLCGTDVSKNMCPGGDGYAAHGNNVYSCRRVLGPPIYKIEYYNFWVSKGSMLYCNGTAYSTDSTSNPGIVNITIYNNYGSTDDALNASKVSDDSGVDDVYNRLHNNGSGGNNNSSGGVGGFMPNASASSSSVLGSGSGTGSILGNVSASGVGDCKPGQDTVNCVFLGTNAQVNDAISGVSSGSDFVIGTTDVDLNSFNKSNDFVESGTCPAPKQVKILGTNHEISYQPFCDAAIKLRPIIISVSIFLSFMIVRSAILSKD